MIPAICNDCHWEWCESCEEYDKLILCDECSKKISQRTGE